MRILLDTQALLWYLLNDRKLSTRAEALISEPNNQILVSPASYWEIAIKISLGKYKLPEPFQIFMEREIIENDFTIIPIAISHAATLTQLPFFHRDPFDRLILAQALVERVPVASIDEAFDAYGVERIW